MTAAVFIAAAVHALILMIHFAPELPTDERPEEKTLDITLVQTKTQDAPEQADFLAQANQEGGGNLAEAALPSDPFSMPTITPSNQSAPLPTESDQAAASRSDQRLITAADSPDNRYSNEDSERRDAPAELGLRDMIKMKQEIALRAAQLENDRQADAKAPRRNRISAATKEYRFASYLQDWTENVERVGNLNYPDEALRANLTGHVRLEVILRPDGSVENIVVRQSSGYQILDDAAKRSVRIAAPYAPFDENIRQDTDLLHITRTWFFRGDANTRGSVRVK